ncbi:MAG TPA: hypothetical protein VIV60_07985, partial [Polyangiaceae bacterium]
MTTLAAVLVRQRALPLETVEQAMLRQSLFGGDLATNLLELGSSNESTLLAATATALEAPAVAVGRIGDISPTWLNGLPPTQLLEDAYVPIGVTDTELLVATSAPLPQRVVSDLEARFGKRVALRAALEIRIREAVSKLLGEALDERTSTLLVRLDGALDRARENDATREAAAPETSEQPPASAAPTPRVSISAVTRSLLPLRAAAKASEQPRRLGPFTAAMAEIELTSAQSPGDVITVWLDFAAQYFDYTAVFAVQGDIAAGKAARGAGTVGETFSRIGVPLDLPSALQRAKVTRNWQLTTLEPRGLDRTLARDLGRNTGRVVLLVPICIRERVVLLTYGDHGESDVLLDRVGDVLALQPLVERHLERMLYERKRGGRSLQPPQIRSESPQDRRVAIPPAAAQAHALTESRGLEATDTSTGVAQQPPPGRHPKAHDPHEERTIPVPAQASTDISIVGQGTEDSSGTQVELVNIDESWDLIQPVLSVGDGESARTTRAATNRPSTPVRESSPPGSVWPGASTKPGLVPRLELVTEFDADSSPNHASPTPEIGPSMATSSAQRSPLPVPPQTAPSEQEVAKEPAPEVSQRSTQDALEEPMVRERFERYLHGDAAALDELIAMGDT